jgi:nucleotide-binding universal stress UspA family protein
MPAPRNIVKVVGHGHLRTVQDRSAERVLKPALKTLAAAELLTQPITVIGHAGEEIARAAKKKRADLIIMASRGLSAARAFFFGSVTSIVLARSKTPVLILRSPQAPKRLSLRVGIAVDGSKYGMAAIRYVLKHRFLFGPRPEIKLVHVASQLLTYVPTSALQCCPHPRPPTFKPCRRAHSKTPSAARVICCAMRAWSRRGQAHRQPGRRDRVLCAFAVRLEVGRRMADHVRDVPRHGHRLRRGIGAHLSAGGGSVSFVRHTAHHHGADSAHHNRRAAGPRPARQPVHRHVDDRHGCAGRHHRALRSPLAAIALFLDLSQAAHTDVRQQCAGHARPRSERTPIDQETDMYRRILVAADGSAAADLALEHAFALAKDQRARVRIVHALESLHYLVGLAGAYPFDAPGLLESMRREGQRVLAASLEKARAVAVDAETALLDGHQPTDRVAQIVVQDARNWDADLIVLGTHGRHGFDRVFLGSVAETVLRIASVPVLLVRAK